MATNDFLVVAPGPGANVLTQAQYASRSAVTTGYTSGVAESAAVNKSLRQGTIMAAVVAQYIADITSANSVDDGTTATLLANLKLAIPRHIASLRFTTQITATGNFTVPAGVYAVRVRCWGAGGGGGGTLSGSTDSAAAGGAAGGYREGWVGVTPGQVIACTIGSGGTSGGSNANGGAGGTTSFGAFVTATGGGGGAGISHGNAAGNNSGGSGTGGTFAMIGPGGMGGVNYGTTTFEGGAGGAAFGGASPTRALGLSGLGSNGNSGVFPGGGGSGGCNSGVGGPGANGLIVVDF